MVAEAKPEISNLPPERPGRDESVSDFALRHYSAHAGQWAFLRDPAMFRAAIAGIGGGKTELGAFECVRHCLKWPGIRGLVVAPTYRQLSRPGSTRPKITDVARWWPALQIKEYKAENRIEFPQYRNEAGEPSQIIFGYAQDPDSLRAMEVSFFWIDEAPLCKEDAFLVCQGRIRQPGYPHRGWLTGTPKGRNWVYRRFVESREEWPEARRERYNFHNWTSYDNPLYQYDPEYLEALEESYVKGSDFHRQEMLALFIALAGLVYKQFDEAEHVVGLPHTRRWKRTLAAIDWGIASPGCIIVFAEHNDGRWYAVEEVYERDRIIAGAPGNDWLSVATELNKKWDCRFVADPEDANAIRTFQRAGLPVKLANNKRLEGVREVQNMIVGDKFRVVAGACPNLIAEIGQYHWRTDRDGNPLEDQDPAKEFDHAMDTVRYFAMEVAVGSGGAHYSTTHVRGKRDFAYNR